MSFDLSNYVDAATRLKLLFERYPNASVVADPPCIRDIAGRPFIEVTVTIHCNDEHNRMARASAWEPFPGKTPYTSDSEMMNAETSACARCCGLLGIGLKSSIASLDEVRNRRQTTAEEMHPSNDRPSFERPAPATNEASPQQRNLIKKLLRQKGQPMLGESTLEALSKREAHHMIDELMAMPDAND